MDLKIKDVTEMLNVSETTIRRWLAEGKIPAYKLNKQYRFSRSEIEEWVMSQRIDGGTKDILWNDEREGAADEAADKGSSAQGGMMSYSLYRAVNKGGVFYDVPGTTKEQVIRNTMNILAHTLNLDPDVLTDLLLDRERLMSTALSRGIAVPHTRDFLLGGQHDVVALVRPLKPLENYGALDGKPVDTLFFLFACDDKRHLHLLAKIAHFGGDDAIRKFIESRPEKKELLAFILDWEKKIQ